MTIKQRLNSLICGFFIIAGCHVAAAEQSKPVMWPGVEYDADIPTFEQVLGYEVGERITDYGSMLRYFEALQRAAPDRIKLQTYAKSWQGRQLIYAVIAKPENLAKLDDIAHQTRDLSDPRRISREQADSIIAKLPASVWLQYSVHGDEISPTDAAMFTAYHILAAKNEAVTQNILDKTLTFIDPLQNPDGRERFISQYYGSVGMEHSADRLSAEHNLPWPKGRVNHYLFDMNRDWLAITQPETQGKIAAINHYLPQVVIDLHEMHGDLSYYFAPAARPFNPHMTKTQVANMNAIGKNHGKHFDQFDFDYFTREIFDAFYPGYGDSWPTFYGASASTYEVGSTRGEVFEKNTGEIMTYRDTVRRQFVASVSTVEAAANMREKLLKDFYQYQIDAIATGKKSKQRLFILPNEKNREGNHSLVTLMAEHGVEVKQAQASFKACGNQYQSGSYIIDSAQPRGQFVRTTFSRQVDMSADFVKEQERRRARNLGDQIYDVTGWSLPMMYNVESHSCRKTVKVATTLVDKDQPLKGKLSNPDATVGFIVPWGDMAASRFLTAALRAGIVVKSADEAFVLDGSKRYPAGSLIIENRNNAKGLAAKIQQLADGSGARVDGVNTSWVTKGPSFGSGRTVNMTAPKIAIAWDKPTSALSAGSTRFVIERQLGYPVTAIRTATLKHADLSAYQVLILPEGNYQQSLGKAGAERLKKWLQAGGVLIALGSANRFTTEVENGLLNVKRELAFREKDDKKAEDKEKSVVPGQQFASAEDLAGAIVEQETAPDHVSGVLANVEVDQEHWLTAGVEKNLVTVAYGRDIYTPIKLNSGKNLAWFAAKEKVVASGYMWQENKAQLAFKPFLIHQPTGKGMIIGFTQSPTYRAYMEGLNVLLTNAIFRAAAHAKK